MEGFFGPTLLQGGREVATKEALSGGVVAIYFSAHWCPPCQQYTPLLKRAYEKIRAKGKAFDVVFVSSDRDEAGFRHYFGTMPWHAVPFSNPVPKQALSQAFQIRGIPALVLLDGAGRLLDPSAKAKAIAPSFAATLPRQLDLVDVGPLPTGPVELVLRHNGNELPLECEPEEGWEMLRMQVFSLTEVPAEQQRLFGLGVPCGPLDESVPLPRALAGGLAAMRGSGKALAGVVTRTASSCEGDSVPGSGCHRGELASPAGWVCKADDKAPWYQMDLGEAKLVAGVAVAPRADAAQWVTRFTVMCGEEEAALAAVGDFDGCACWLQAPRRAVFAKPVRARYVRVVPRAHVGARALRADVLLEEGGGPDLPPALLLLGNFSKGDPFELGAEAAADANAKLMEEQHLAMLQAKLSSAPQRLQGQVGSLQHVLKYEETALQRQALDEVPVMGMDLEACGKAEAYDVAFMKQLLRWFKHGFFSWVNVPRCEHCGSTDTKRAGGAQATPQEQQYGAGTVELAHCNSCGGQTRFPRYNEPSMLLETKAGRCGEWANCFTLVCRALGFEARHVHDWTDHVWTEVYSESAQRWLHADSCEAALDTPLVYEQGWGKKLTYIIAFARDHVVDVSRRYTRKYEELLSRRTQFSEAQLRQALAAIGEFATDRALAGLACAEERRALLESRGELEKAELEGAAAAAVKAEEQVGRTSGDKEWREQRNELGATAAAKEQALQLSEQGLAAVTEPSKPAAAEASKPAAAEAPKAAEEAPKPAAKQDVQAAVKALFAKHVAAGLPPNEAAARAMKEAAAAAAAAP